MHTAWNNRVRRVLSFYLVGEANEEESKYLEQEVMFEADKPAEPGREAIQESDLNSLAQSDSLRLYLREISRISLLNAPRQPLPAEPAEQGDKRTHTKLIHPNLHPSSSLLTNNL